jgi:hypothetical protein
VLADNLHHCNDLRYHRSRSILGQVFSLEVLDFGHGGSERHFSVLGEEAEECLEFCCSSHGNLFLEANYKCKLSVLKCFLKADER